VTGKKRVPDVELNSDDGSIRNYSEHHSTIHRDSITSFSEGKNMPTIINPERQAKKKAMVGEKSGKSFKRKLKAARAVRPQYYKD
jgi:hypothetical protein